MATTKKPAHGKNVASTTTLDIQNELDYAEEAGFAPAAAVPRSSSVPGRRPLPVVVDMSAASAPAAPTTTTIVAATTDCISDGLLARVARMESQLSGLAVIVAGLVDRVEQMESWAAAAMVVGSGNGMDNGHRRGRGRGLHQQGKRGSGMARAN
ncbi:hypothetical protein DV736_g369, partial [Chaetothyriales sp. CBS 134916]